MKNGLIALVCFISTCAAANEPLPVESVNFDQCSRLYQPERNHCLLRLSAQVALLRVRVRNAEGGVVAANVIVLNRDRTVRQWLFGSHSRATETLLSLKRWDTYVLTVWPHNEKDGGNGHPYVQEFEQIVNYDAQLFDNPDAILTLTVPRR